MLTDVFLHGELGVKYGTHHRFDINNACQAARALAANYKEFYRDFVDGFYIIKVGDEELSDNALQRAINKERPVHIIPVVGGSKKGGGVKAIAGIALLAVATGGAAAAVGPFAAGTSAFSATAFSIGSYAVSYGSLALSGVSMLLQGVSSLLTSTPSTNYDTRNPVDQRPSALFNGQTNRSAEGTVVPLVYGEFIVGSVVASAGLEIEQIL